MKACRYCDRPGPVRVKKGELDAAEDLRACDQCWKLLQDPATALPLIRGHMSMELRGRLPEPMREAFERLMGRLARMRRPG